MQLPEPPPRAEVCLLHEVFGPVRVAGFQVRAGVDEPGGPADEFLERRPIPAAAARQQRGLVVDKRSVIFAARLARNRLPT